MRHSLKSHGKAIVGVALLGLGCFVLFEHLSHVAAQLTHLCSVPCVAPGGLADLLASWRLDPLDQKRFVHALPRHVLVSCWPFLLVWAGSALSRETFADDVTPLPANPNREEPAPKQKLGKNLFGNVDLAAPHSTSK